MSSEYRQELKAAREEKRSFQKSKTSHNCLFGQVQANEETLLRYRTSKVAVKIRELVLVPSPLSEEDGWRVVINLWKDGLLMKTDSLKVQAYEAPIISLSPGMEVSVTATCKSDNPKPFQYTLDFLVDIDG